MNELPYWTRRKVQAALEKDIEKKLKKEISRVIDRIQELESDIFGFWGKYRRTVRQSKLTKEV
ncbi:Ger(x)C family spore germination C-terminal domain-containing protein [Lysinibacillus sphaericus]|uniref:Ger(x)C family spore germination C-terminal domain-containing protein n=1 Tax=Lysinibacillus sphaericus TaxID=1421 RepID=UPI0009B86B2B|nr:Ger(x)C family spore germination C-terminal domain-containing protein [Lysinibacillus sphaericus]MDR0158810.1 Ger(x)C family spore germination C-terminal domain-containing protein [Lysinibacillus sphaericus]